MDGKKNVEEGGIRCGNLDCGVTGRDKVNQVCAACRAVRYCSRKCQRQHWSSRGGNHRAHCQPPPKPEASGPPSASPRGPPPAAPASWGNDADDPEHPCPVCLVNEDDHGECGQCSECGQLYCGECNVPERMGRLAGCPTCRAPIAVAAEVKVERLLRLVGRSPGRHTPGAQNCLGYAYANGEGVAQNHEEAVKWYQLAADQGSALAQSSLGGMYAAGKGVAQSNEEAVKWSRLAADQGNADAQFILGCMYAGYTGGLGVEHDLDQAEHWLKLAADQAHAHAQQALLPLAEERKASTTTTTATDPGGDGGDGDDGDSQTLLAILAAAEGTVTFFFWCRNWFLTILVCCVLFSLAPGSLIIPVAVLTYINFFNSPERIDDPSDWG